jgi:hypothetical protein
MLIPPRPVSAQAEVLAVNLGTTNISEGDDFATRVLGMPWDMSSGPYPDFPTVFDNVARNTFSASGGVWSYTTSSNDPNVWLLWPSLAGIQKVLRMGDRFPIQSSKYKLLTFRLCSNAADNLNLYWYNAPLSSTPTTTGVSTYVGVSSGCKVYTINLAQIATIQPSLAWSGNIHGLRLDPAVTSGRSMQLDWARLTTIATANVVPIQWSGVSTGTTLHFYLNSSCTASGATPIGTAPRTGSNGTFSWGSSLQPNGSSATPYPLPESFQPGSYTVVMLVDGAGTPSCPGLQLQIRKAPRLSFQQPSMFSGPDYASQVVSNEWGMADAADMESTGGLASSSFASGEFFGVTNNHGDPQLYLNVTSPIDTSKYRFVTFRYWLEGTDIFPAGGVGRFLWWFNNPAADRVTSEDIVLYEGWHTYTVDLSQAPLESAPATLGPGWTASPTVFRFDPHEIASGQRRFHLDYMILTGYDSVRAGTPFSIYYTVAADSAVTITWYYDTDTNVSNGRNALSVTTPSAPQANHKIFVPLVLRAGAAAEIQLLTGPTATWNTSVAPGTYYISADVSDGFTTTTWYSETPVIVTP